jgi:diguanylate cyclase (GGDEF)-like protein
MKKRIPKIIDPDFKKHIEGVLEEVKNSLFELHDTVIRDEKTKLYNHRFFKNIFGMELEKSKRGMQNLSLIIIDIDFFKRFNDTYGHLVGDDVLIELAKVLQKTVRKYDVPSRFGGEEFFILLPSTNITKAKKIAERLRLSLPKNKLLKKYNVQISLGVTEYKKLDTQKKMINRADKALYISKKNGRNQTNVL